MPKPALRQRRSCAFGLLVLSSLLPAVLGNAAAADERLGQSSFEQIVAPFIKTHCWQCHDAESREGDLDLSGPVDLNRDFVRWNVVLERVRAGEMPPADTDPQPSQQQRDAVIAWISNWRAAEALRTQGDPGPVLARRLSNSELDHTIADLTGVRIDPAKSFPVDPANPAGFDNTGESLAMSPSLLRKYLDAARHVAEHMVLTPTGIDFAPYPVVTATDRDRYCVNRIVDFYQRQTTDYAPYLMVLWQAQFQPDTDQAAMLRRRLAGEAALSLRYTETLWSLIHTDPPPPSTQEPETQTIATGPIAAIQTLWRDLPGVGSQWGQAELDLHRADAEAGCRQIADFIESLRAALVPEVPNLTAPQINSGSQALVLWKNRQFVANRRRYAGGGIPDGNFGLPADAAALQVLRHPASDPAELEQSLTQFCDLFPDAFYISERARVYLNPEQEKKRSGRLLSAGFHSQMGYFRDDAPLMDLMLDEEQQAELNRMWAELDFVTDAPQRQYSGFIWFDRTDSGFMRDREFDIYRAEDKDNSAEKKLRGLEAAYTAKAQRVGASADALAAMHRYFDDMSATFRRLEEQRLASQPVHLEALIEFAGRAFRRPLTERQRDQITSFYRMLRDEGLSHEDAIADGLIRILMTPEFCYRVDLANTQTPATDADTQTAATQSPDNDATRPATVPLDDFDLASRLSYFLWSSLPDDELLDLAREGRLHQPDVLVAQGRRMLQDPRSNRFVTELIGHWLDFRRFEQHNGVDRSRFQSFDDDLRQAMFEEPIRFVSDLIARDGSVMELLYADHMIINDKLAAHYGVPAEVLERAAAGSPRADRWVRIDNAARWDRGGLVPMAVFLTSSSPGLRTSPVKRGNWIVQRLLGEHVPPPPPSVPDLPEDESALGDLSLRETLARHRADPSCATCHEKIDSFGLVLEGYGPVGERRTVDLGGREIDDSVQFPDDSHGTGVAGLLRYIRDQRQDDFVDKLCRQTLAYALGRSLQLSDEPLIVEMRSELAANDFRFSVLVDQIVSSPVFRNKRAE